MVKLSQQETKSLVALHGWSAVLLGLLLYAVVATGAVAVLAEEIRHWSIGSVKHENPLLSDVDSIVRNLSASVEPEFLEEVGMGASPMATWSCFFIPIATNPMAKSKSMVWSSRLTRRPMRCWTNARARAWNFTGRRTHRP